MSDTASDPDVSKLAREVISELDPGTVIDDRVILSKSQAVAIMAGGATLAGVLGLSAGSARAQSSGQLGTASEPIDAELGNYGATSTADGYQITIDGDTFELNE